jgi:uncharacterized delta-60 repeat protein
MQISRLVRFTSIALFVALGASACGGGDDATPPPVVVTPPPPPPPPPPGTLVGAAGGTVTGPNGTTVVIPAGALSSEVRILIEQTSVGAPALPSGFAVAGLTFAFTPHGTTFAVPVTITLPFDPALVPAGRSPVLYKTINGQTQWQEISPATLTANTISAAVTSFSLAEAVVPPLFAGRPVHEWQAAVLRGGALIPDEFPEGRQDAGDVNVSFDYGDILPFPGGIALPTDGFATGDVFATADGTDWSIATESPVGFVSNPEGSIGSQIEFRQTQTFRKLTDDATLSFTVTDAFLETIDANAVLGRLCPPSFRHGLECDLMKAEIILQVEAFTVPASVEPFDVFFRVQGDATLVGKAESWASYASTGPFSMSPLWTVEDFDFTVDSLNGSPEALVTMQLRQPLTYVVDLSEIPVGQAFTLQSFAIVSAYNRGVAGSEFATGARALLRDPLNVGSISITQTGLEAEASDSFTPPISGPLSPEACPGPAPDPAAGTIQFSAANYDQLESSRTPVVTVTRLGGATGAVTATLSSSNGTAVAGEDYEAINSTVFFADGDATPRSFAVPIIADDGRFESGRTVNLRLSQPGGCAALGAQDTTLVTILDVDPPPPLPSGLDESFGTLGEATLEAFGGDRSGMALQPDGKIVMVGGTFTDFVMARFNADGTLDTGFGAEGKVTTNIVSNEIEEALGVAVQADGKIVVVGHTGQAVGGPVFAVARYNSDGSLDTTFATGGINTGAVLGRAFDVVIQPVGAELKILVVGDLNVAGDFAVVRYNSNGTVDPGFGVGGVVITDVAGEGDVATNVALDSAGRIVVSGGSSTGLNNTSIARYLANGAPDTAFANNGRLALIGKNLGAGLAVQADGSIILAGNLETLLPPATQKVFEIMRLTPSGQPDATFGTAGIVTTPVSTRGDSALSVVVQPDGKIVAAGVSSSQTNSNFAVVRYDTHGVLDPTFHAGTGMVVVDFFGFTDIAETVLLQPDGKILLGGLARNNVDGYGLARINP